MNSDPKIANKKFKCNLTEQIIFPGLDLVPDNSFSKRKIFYTAFWL